VPTPVKGVRMVCLPAGLKTRLYES